MTNHDENGKFALGNKASPGRSPKAVERAYLAELVDEVTAEDWRKIARKAKQDAIKGNPDARRWLSDYILGKPSQAIDLRGEGNGLIAAEWLIIRTALLEALLPYPEARQRVAEALLKAENTVDSE